MLKLKELEYEILRAKEKKKQIIKLSYDCESLCILKETERERTEKGANNQREAKYSDRVCLDILEKFWRKEDETEKKY